MANAGSLRMVAIDPGKSLLGLALYTVDVDGFKVESIDAFAVKPITDDVSEYGIGIDRVEHFTMIDSQATQVGRHLSVFMPSVVVIEIPFFNPRRPGAFRPLIELLTRLISTIDGLLPYAVIVSYEPRTVKKNIGAVTMSEKSAVKDAVKRTTELMDVLSGDIDNMPPDAVDAIAIGYKHICVLRDMYKPRVLKKR